MVNLITMQITCFGVENLKVLRELYITLYQTNKYRQSMGPNNPSLGPMSYTAKNGLL